MTRLASGSALIGMVVLSVLGSACAHQAAAKPRGIWFTRVPKADTRAGVTDVISGQTAGATVGQRVVLYVHSGKWWLQPLETEPFTELSANGSWVNNTHLGTEYAALLVDKGYVPPLSAVDLPAIGQGVAARVSVVGRATSPSPVLRFSGYEWRVRTAPSNRGNAFNNYDPSNAWTDAGGALHLRIARNKKDWACAEMALTRSLGYGTYRVQVRDLAGFDPAAVFAIFTFDYAGEGNNNREVGVEISRWGDPASKNAQYVVQPFHVPTNVHRFMLPGGTMTHVLRWRAGRMSFETDAASGMRVAQHEFTSNVPEPGLESMRMALYVFRDGPMKLRGPEEVVVDRFEYLP